MKRLDQLLLGDRLGRATGSSDAHQPAADTHGVPGVAHSLSISGQSFVQNAVGSNFGSIFVILDEFHHRHQPGTSANEIAGKIRAVCNSEIHDGLVSVFGPPPVDGLGSGGGFKIMIRDVSDLGLPALQAAADSLSEMGTQEPGLLAMFNGFRASTPQMYVDVDRAKCKSLGVSLQEVFSTLQLYLGGTYANDFNQFGRTWQVNLQADANFRLRPENVSQFRIRSNAGALIPLGSVATISESTGPALVTRYNGSNAATINGVALPTLSSGEVVKKVDRLTGQALPAGLVPEWTELTLLQIKAGNTALIVFAVAVLLVVLVLAAQYESVTLPLAVVLVVPMCLLCSVAGIAAAKLDINIFVQIGFVVLVGLASKNAILIVEFAKERQSQGSSRFEATIEACRLRLRPIMMTSFAFILGVVPLALASGAGAEMRRPLGIAVFSGMLGVTFFGIFLTPVFYYLLAGRRGVR
jgi:multidrug efflux pump